MEHRLVRKDWVNDSRELLNLLPAEQAKLVLYNKLTKTAKLRVSTLDPAVATVAFIASTF